MTGILQMMYWIGLNFYKSIFMEREIKFRGKSLSTGEWVYGYYLYSEVEEIHYIATSAFEHGFTEVDPKTVGQYIGRKDPKGTEIYTDDLFQYDADWDGFYYAIMQFSEDFHDDPSFHAVDLDNRSEYIDIDGLEVFGSIHDNPTLLTQ